MARGFLKAAETGHGIVAMVPLLRFSCTGDSTVDAPNEFPLTDTVAS